MKFLIQTINGEIKHDFSFTLLQSIEYWKWRNNGIFDYELREEKMSPKCIPIGSVEFVQKYLSHHFNLIPKPKNIPTELLNQVFTGRKVINGTEKDIKGKMFAKSNDGIKQFTEFCTEAPEGNYQISEIVEIESEWRAFVYEGKLVGLNNYSGEFDVFPDVSKIKRMIAAYNSQPIAYTLDVGIVKGNTVVIEVHDFFSCGFYGFAEHKFIPFMFSKWFNQYTGGAGF